MEREQGSLASLIGLTLSWYGRNFSNDLVLRCYISVIFCKCRMLHYPAHPDIIGANYSNMVVSSTSAQSFPQHIYLDSPSALSQSSWPRHFIGTVPMSAQALLRYWSRCYFSNALILARVFPQCRSVSQCCSEHSLGAALILAWASPWNHLGSVPISAWLLPQYQSGHFLFIVPMSPLPLKWLRLE